MDKTMVRNVALSAALVAGLGFGGLTLAANAAESSAKADTKAAASSKADTKAAASSKADKSGAADKSAAADKAAAGSFKDGTYQASSKGIGGDVPVTVTISGGKITAVEVGDNSETQGVGSKAIEQLPAKIVEANGTDGVDGVSGASVTSKAIFTAVNDCLQQAQA